MINKEKVRKIFENLYDEVEVKKAYYDGYIQGLKAFRDNMVRELDKIEPIPAEKLAAGSLSASAVDGIGKIKLCAKVLDVTEEELKEILKNDSND